MRTSFLLPGWHMGIIYSATNVVNGKMYIGRTVHSIEERKRGHEYSVRYGSQTLFHRAIRKYGWDTFIWKIIKDNVETEHLPQEETRLIRIFESATDGYNMVEEGAGGGVPGRVFSASHRRSLSRTAKSRQISQEVIEGRIRAGLKKRGNSPSAVTIEQRATTCRATWNKKREEGTAATGPTPERTRDLLCRIITGKKRTEETKAAMSAAQKKRHSERPISPETREKQRASACNRKNRRTDEERLEWKRLRSLKKRLARARDKREGRVA